MFSAPKFSTKESSLHEFIFSKNYSPHPLSHDIGLLPSQPFHHSSIDICKAKKSLFPSLICSISHLELDIIASNVHNPHSQFQLKPLCIPQGSYIGTTNGSIYIPIQILAFSLSSMSQILIELSLIHILLSQEQMECNIKSRIRILAITCVLQPTHNKLVLLHKNV